jgi:hypothetical protein
MEQIFSIFYCSYAAFDYKNCFPSRSHKMIMNSELNEKLFILLGCMLCVFVCNWMDGRKRETGKLELKHPGTNKGNYKKLESFLTSQQHKFYART